jgi:hypothetical protein
MRKPAAGFTDTTPDHVRCVCGHDRSNHTFGVADCPGADRCDGYNEPDPENHGVHLMTPCNMCECDDLEAIDADRNIERKIIHNRSDAN